MQTIYQPASGILDVKYGPDEHTDHIENPPRFTWMPVQLQEDHYCLQISKDKDFSPEQTETIESIPYNFYTPNHALEAGTYYWRYCQVDKASNSILSSWSEVRRFDMPEQLPDTSLPSREERYKDVNLAHPRLWLGPEEVKVFREKIKKDPTHCRWDVFYEKSVTPWLERELMPEPKPYPENKRVIKLWRQMYLDCQETLYAVRHLSVAGVILEDEKIISRAKEWLLHVANWDTEGTTSRDYNDECAFRIVAALAWGYDWLYHHLSAEEKGLVRHSLLRRTEQVADHNIKRSKIHQVPYDSHAVRSLSSVLVPCSIALLEDAEEVKDWLDYTLEYYAAIYTPWGGKDGGWAEGGMYWTTGMAYLIDALNLVKNYMEIDFYKRPFFQKTGDFPLYCYSQDTRKASFGDQSNLGERPGLKTAFNIRQFAGVTGNGLYQWYYEQVKAWDTEADQKFFNYGWWDFPFDDMIYLHDFPEVEATPPTDAETAKWFKDVGWVALHHKMDQPEDHIMFLTKSSPYGSLSHSHGDQNSFLLHAYGEPLVIKSGYYIGFSSTMHKKWRRQTQAHNTLLIDGVGQYADSNKVLNMSSKGNVLEVTSNDEYSYVREDATLAYSATVPYLERFEREIYFINNSYFVIVDNVDLKQEGSVNWLLHSLHKMDIKDQSFKIAGEKADLQGQFVYSSSGDLFLDQTDQFNDVDPEEVEGLPNEWHLNAVTKKSNRHRIVTLLTPNRKDEQKYVSYFMDDQDHGVNIYFTEDGKTTCVEVKKAY
ncbi:DUF4962 domain-containing protein [Bacillus weihaiensis]|uniref:DUF4962 domain-containing protein n=1 Tax=Bacillus weihaiensis TaxID=1547283 RepID=UPI002355ACE2|nr:DUF4962 domain-containing protein [Bacillus weihaiensis]